MTKNGKMELGRPLRVEVIIKPKLPEEKVAVPRR